MDLNKIYSMMDRLDSSFLLTEEAMILMEATRDEIYDVYYDEQNGRAKRIARQIFDTICNMDPTARENQVGPFAKWIFNMWDTTKMNEGQLEEYMGMPETFKRDVQTFVKLKNVKCPYVQHDLNKYDLNTFKKTMEEARDNDWDKSKKELMNDGTIVLYEDSEWKVLVPLKYESEKKYGSGTAWCTAPNESTYKRYASLGRLVIIIHKTEPITTDGSEKMDQRNRNPKRKYQILIHNNGFIDKEARWECCDADDEHFYYDKEFPETIVKVIDGFAGSIRAEQMKIHGGNINNIASRLNCNPDMVNFVGDVVPFKYSVERECSETVFYRYKIGGHNTPAKGFVLVNRENGKILECNGSLLLDNANSALMLYGKKLKDGHEYINVTFVGDVDGLIGKNFIYDVTDESPVLFHGYGEWNLYYTFGNKFAIYSVNDRGIEDKKKWGTIICDRSPESNIIYGNVKGSPNGIGTDGKNWFYVKVGSKRKILYNTKLDKFVCLTKSKVVREVHEISENYTFVEIGKNKTVILSNSDCSVVKGNKNKPLYISCYTVKSGRAYVSIEFLNEPERDGIYDVNTLKRIVCSFGDGYTIRDMLRVSYNTPQMAKIEYPDGKLRYNFVSLEGENVTPVKLLDTYEYHVWPYSYVSIYNADNVSIMRASLGENKDLFVICDFNDLQNPKFKLITIGKTRIFNSTISIYHNYSEDTSFLGIENGDKIYAVRIFNSDDGVDYEVYKHPIRMQRNSYYEREWVLGGKVYKDNEIYKRMFKKKPCLYIS